MIVGERIIEVSGKRENRTDLKSISINISLEDVKLVEGMLEMSYIYTAKYEEELGEIKIKGIIMAKEEEKLSKEVVDSWKKTKKVPDSYATTVLSAVNYGGSANG
ncbi:hypothetical protein HZC07_00430, partial [Candidatus Micrarchaeota archaeon]|nr:hypothetical protein [Candidatus Micrarchaeota archaeon]